MIFSPFFVIFMQLFCSKEQQHFMQEIVVRYSGLYPLSHRQQAISDKLLHWVS